MIILASNSQIRADILRQAGVAFETMPARVDEDMIKAALVAEQGAPRDIADALAEAKSQKISRKAPGALVLGADQVLSLDGQLISKSESQAEMIETLRHLRGKKHKLYSAAVISLDSAPIWRFIGEAQIVMRDFSDEFLRDYVEAHFQSVKSSVGGYQIEGIGAQLIEDYRGDYFSVLGLPLFPILSFLRERGVLAK